MSGPQTILITGGTGHVGSRTLMLALRAGYHVRLAVRSQERADEAIRMLSRIHQFFSTPPDSEFKFDMSLISFVIVPDMTAPDAYYEAVKGVDAVIHIASPITTGNQFESQEEYEKYFMLPSRQGALSMLEAAKKELSVKRVILTSSIVSVAPFDDIFVKETSIFVDADSSVPVDHGPYASEYPAYAASKVAAHNAALAFMSDKKPSFDLVILAPGWVLGPDYMHTDAEKSLTGTNRAVVQLALGQTLGFKIPSGVVHNEDVARSHVEALNRDKIPAGVYILVSNPSSGPGTAEWENVVNIVQAKYPEEIRKGVFKTGGVIETNKVKIDGSKASNTFGFQYRNFEDMVTSVLDYYLRLRKA